MKRGETWGGAAAGWVLILLTFRLLGGWVVDQGFPGATYRSGGVALVVVIVGVAVGIAVHELAHAAVGALTGFRVFMVVVGSGPRLASWDVGRVAYELRALPLGGATLMATDRRAGFTARRVVTLLAGPAGSAAFAMALLAWRPSSPQADLGRLVLVFIQIALVVTNLQPTSGRTERGLLRTDGGQVLDTLRDPEGQWDAQADVFSSMDAWVHLRRGRSEQALAVLDALEDRPEASAVQVLQEAGLRLESGDAAGALRLARAGCEAGLEGDPGLAGPLANMAAYAALCLDERALLADIDRFSELAWAALPEEVAVVDTRGWALVELGRPAEGRPLLLRAAAAARGDAATGVEAHLLICALAERDLLHARTLAGRLARQVASEPSVAVALRRYAEEVRSLSDDQRAALARFGRP